MRAYTLIVLGLLATACDDGSDVGDEGDDPYNGDDGGENIQQCGPGTWTVNVAISGGGACANGTSQEQLQFVVDDNGNVTTTETGTITYSNFGTSGDNSSCLLEVVLDSGQGIVLDVVAASDLQGNVTGTGGVDYESCHWDIDVTSGTYDF